MRDKSLGNEEGSVRVRQPNEVGILSESVNATILVVCRWEGGKPLMKSMEMFDHTRVGNGENCR